MKDQAKKEARDFLMAQKVGVLSTLADGKPHGTYIYYVADENCDIYFTTVVNSSKHKNILANSNVAFTIGTITPPQTVQIEGIAEVVTDENTTKALTALYVDIASHNNDFPVPLTKLDWEQGVIMYRIRPLSLKWFDFTDAHKK